MTNNRFTNIAGFFPKGPCSGLAMFCLAAGPVLGATASRTIQDQAGSVTVQVDIQPDAGTRAFAVEESLPQGVLGRNISEGGFFDPDTGKVKWGPFTDNQPRLLTYELIATQTSVASITGVASFDGTQSFAVQGDAQTELEASGFEAWLISELGPRALTRPESNPEYNGDGDPFPVSVEYYFGLDPDEFDENPVVTEMDADTQTVNVSYIRQKNDGGRYNLDVEETGDFVVWKPIEVAPGQPLIEDLGGGLERVEYQLPADRAVRIIQFVLDVLP